jgi:hypothetical protein
VIEAKVFTELATGIAEEEKINAENARCCWKTTIFVKYESRKYVI